METGVSPALDGHRFFQIERLQQCERMLVIMQLSGWLNEPNLALQAVVQCYGLLAPLIHYKIPSTPVIQVRRHAQRRRSLRMPCSNRCLTLGHGYTGM